MHHHCLAIAVFLFHLLYDLDMQFILYPTLVLVAFYVVLIGVPIDPVFYLCSLSNKLTADCRVILVSLSFRIY